MTKQTKHKSILTETITSVTEIYIEKELDSDARVRFQTMIFPDHSAGKAHRYEVIRLDLNQGRFEIIGRELDLVSARRVATKNPCETPEDYLNEHCDGFERGHDDHDCIAANHADLEQDCYVCGSLHDCIVCIEAEEREIARVNDQALSAARELPVVSHVQCHECGDILDAQGNCPDCAQHEKRERAKFRACLDLYGNPVSPYKTRLDKPA